MLYVSHYLPCTEVLGPGKRFALWLQGCERRCPGCINPAGWSLDSGGTYFSVDSMVNIICAAAPGLTGITVSGGEPLLQYKQLQSLFSQLAERVNLDVMLYTGYTLSEAREFLGNKADEFFKWLDIMVDGTYEASEDHNEMLRGSANQCFHFFTDKYRPWAKRLLVLKNRSFEFHCLADGEVWMAGLPPNGFEQDLQRMLREFGNSHEAE